MTLHKERNIVDMHCDTVIEGWRHPEKSIVDGDFSVNLDLLYNDGSLVQFFALYLSRIELKTMSPMELLDSLYGYYENMLREHADLIEPVYKYEDIVKNQKADKPSALLTIEDGVFLEGQMERLYKAYDMGVRLVTILWNFENSVGYPSSDNQAEHEKGLKPFGIEVVEEMNRLGMIVDVSHLSEGGFYDVAKYSKKPFVASHSCARALCNHRRNLTDKQLKTLGTAGGVAGVNFERSFLKVGSNRATFDQILQHLKYMVDKAGIDGVGFGSDFDGIEDSGELVNYSGYQVLLQKMEKDFTYDQIDKISHLNSLRVIREVLG